MDPGGPLVFLVRKSSQHCFARAVAETVQPRSVRCRWRTGWVGGRLLQRSALPADMVTCHALTRGNLVPLALPCVGLRWGQEKGWGQVCGGKGTFPLLAKAGVLPSRRSPSPLKEAKLAFYLPPAASKTHSWRSRNIILFHLKTFHFMCN